MAQIIKRGKLHYKDKRGNDYVIYPYTDATLVQMEDGSTLQETINNLKKLVTGIKFEIGRDEWETFDEENGIKAFRLNHNLNIKIENFSIGFYSNNENISLDYKILDLNTLELYSDEEIDIVVSIKQAVESNFNMPQEILKKIDNSYDKALENEKTILSKAEEKHSHDIKDIKNIDKVAAYNTKDIQDNSAMTIKHILEHIIDGNIDKEHLKEMLKSL